MPDAYTPPVIQRWITTSNPQEVQASRGGEKATQDKKHSESNENTENDDYNSLWGRGIVEKNSLNS